ncbi:MAG: hypothetical protein AUJ92_01415 [Armatimonadetes bacterium CG2_30_59_28]|nr:hypothetical protein [Armatimonadota bacterium]OIO98407.1 MAG: hypothetical protein AUJ92_01415 [Armatimonadetes bacterium CG2_30_59_28]PIU62061.1 MAG: hypothetical protein COS85_19605 [Armatimonadetes bacterium CG07_land_8_20_14_0_80_59_28]PIY48637.1 MAG: hypothetical protein COZ05_02650 [Armatimonadetes bacterium CG_4_10_14_3_um_filter_59_10]
MTEAMITLRRAIEALRAGVPNRDAVRVLGCSQPHIEEMFQQQLGECPTLSADGKQVPGLLVMGGFGSGKSHLLEHLHHAALEQGFVSSRIVISKETPLFDPSKLYRAAIDAAVVPDKKGSALREIAQTLDRAPGYPSFYQRVTSDTSEFDTRFAASLVVYENAKGRDIDLCDRVVSFWSGHKLNVTEFRKALKQCGEAVTYPIGKIAPRDLALQRFRFATQLMLAAGYPGWVLLFDEVELICRYSLLQRAKSYAEFARRMGALKGETVPGMVTVFASTDDLGLAVLEKDEDQVPAKLAVRDSDGDSLLSSQARCGMRKLREAVALTPPDRAMIEETKEKLRQVHAQAYDWSPSPARFAGEVLTTTRMRTYVRSWINQWDLERLYPGYTAEIETKEIQTTLEEDRDLEHTSDPNEESEWGAAHQSVVREGC